MQAYSLNIKRKIMEIRNRLSDKLVGEVRDVVVIEPTIAFPDEKIEDVVVRISDDLRTRHVYVVDESRKLLGSFRMNSVLKYLFPYSELINDGITLNRESVSNFFAVDISEVMNVSPLYVRDYMKLDECAELMLSEGINELPVVDSEMKLTGQISVFAMIEAYKNFISGTTQKERCVKNA